MGLILYFKMQQFWLLLHHFNTKNQFRIRKKEENVCLGVWDDVTILSNLKIKKLIDPNLKVTQHAYLFSKSSSLEKWFSHYYGLGDPKDVTKIQDLGLSYHFSYLGIRFFFHFVKSCFSNWWKSAIINWKGPFQNCENTRDDSFYLWHFWKL